MPLKCEECNHTLSDAQIEHIAELSAKKAVAMMTASMYQSIGKSFVDKALFIIGLGVVALAVYLNNKGYING